MSDITDRLELDGEVTMRDIIIAHVLQNSTTDELANELESRLNAGETNEEFQNIKNRALIDELTQRLSGMGMLITTAAMIEDVGLSSITADFGYGLMDTYTHVSSSQENF